MLLKPKDIHVWSTNLNISTEQEQAKLNLLSSDEIARANRFHVPIHRKRFIAARATLRELICLYLKLPAQAITFKYTSYGKPYLPDAFNFIQLQFNLAHSHDIAIYAFTLKHAIGIDIEKIQAQYTPAIAKRYFTAKENADLADLPLVKRANGFYNIWSRKEAIIKAIGKGLSIPLCRFSVSLDRTSEAIELEHKTWQLIELKIDPNYQSALATDQSIESQPLAFFI